jgi:P-type conjugative transfer protein TrbJ
MRKWFLAVAIATAFFVATPSPAHAQIPVSDLGEWGLTIWSEIARFGQMVESYAQQAQMIYNQYESLKHQVQNLEKLQVHSFRDVYSLLNDTEGALRSGNNLLFAWDDIDGIWQETFPSDSDSYGAYGVSRARQVYRTMETLRGSLGVMHSQYQHLYQSMATLDEIKGHVATARGAEAVSEALGELAAWQADQVATENLAQQAAANASAAAEAERIVHERQLETAFETAMSSTSKTVARARFGDSYKRYSALPDWMPL